MELVDAVKTRQNVLVITSDFGENIQIVSKHETADQYFHRLEVCLFGSVCLLAKEGENPEKFEDYRFSHIITSDYKYINNPKSKSKKRLFFRVKDNMFVFCVLQKVIQSSLQKAQELGVRIDHIVHKVFRLIFW